MPKPPLLKAHCNECGGERNHLIRNTIKRAGEDHISSTFSVSWGEDFLLLECRGCESIKLLHRSWFSEETDPDGNPIVKSRYYPPSTFRKHPHWLGNLDHEWHLTKLVKEIYQAMQNAAPALAAMGIRAAIETIMIDKVEDQGSFAKNLEAFRVAGFISASQLKSLNMALELGHATIHRGHEPKATQLETALDILENVMHGLYILEPQSKFDASMLPKRRQ